MLPDHFAVFRSVARREGCWIGLREPNPLGDRWIGRPQYVPKPLSCKAKTATNLNHPFGGLVVSPLLCPGAFTSSTMAKAKECWNEKFLTGGQLPASFSVTPDGLVKTHGACIHPDYDLMSVVRSNSSGEMIHTSHSEELSLFIELQWEINHDLGIDMIQHGTEFMFTTGIGAADFEYILWFGPNGRFRRGPSSNQMK